MAATVIINEWTSTATQTDKTSGTVRMKNANDPTVDSNDPLVIPTSGSDFSYTKWLQLRITGTPPSDKINNLQFYTDGANGFGTGVNLWAKSAAAFSTPSEPTTSSGYANAFGLTVGGALALSSSDFSGSGTNIGSFVTLLMEVSATATVGALTAETVTFSYDEI